MVAASPESRKEQRRSLRIPIELLVSRLAVSQGSILVDAWVIDFSSAGMRVAIPVIESSLCHFLDEYGPQRVIRLVCKFHDAQGPFGVPGTVIHFGNDPDEAPGGCIVGIGFDPTDHVMNRRLAELEWGASGDV